MPQATAPGPSPGSDADQKPRTVLISVDPSDTDLSPADVELKQNGKLAEVSKVRKLGRIPVHYCVLVDISGSRREQLEFERKSVLAVLDGVVKPGIDHGWVLLFNDRKQESTETTNPQALWKVVLNERAQGATNLDDAVESCASRMLKGEGEKGDELRTMFLFTDGEDDSSHVTGREAMDRSINTGLRIYVSLPDHLSERADHMMSMFTKGTGGRMFQADINGAVKRISRDLDGLAELTYAPISGSENTNRIALEVRSRRKGLRILAPQNVAAQQP